MENVSFSWCEIGVNWDKACPLLALHKFFSKTSIDIPPKPLGNLLGYKLHVRQNL